VANADDVAKAQALLHGTPNHCCEASAHKNQTVIEFSALTTWALTQSAEPDDKHLLDVNSGFKLSHCS
jgi:hypothetical protein